MNCVVTNCDFESQSHLQCFPRSSFLYERWRQAVELGTGQPFPRDVDPFEVFICQQHFTRFDGYQEPVIFLNDTLHQQVQLDSCRLCLKIDFSDQIVVDKNVEDLLRTAVGVDLSPVDRSDGICKECLEKLAIIDRTLKFFSKKKDRWLQMQDLIEGENVQWHGNGNHETAKDIDTIEQILEQTKSPLSYAGSKNEVEIKVEIEDAVYDKIIDANEHREEGNQDSLLKELSVESKQHSHSNIPSFQLSLYQCTSCPNKFHNDTDYTIHCLEGCGKQLSRIGPRKCTRQPNEETSPNPISDLMQSLSTSDEYFNNDRGSMETTIINPATADPPAHVCEICQKSLSSAVRLRRHQAVHRSTKTFTCQYCSKEFRARRAWRIHEGFHENKQAYTCDICLECFTHPANMKRHQLLHMGARQHECDTCGRRFTRLSHLHTHLRVHTGEKPYKCPKCDKSFSSHSGIAKHRRKLSCDITRNSKGKDFGVPKKPRKKRG